jgi:heterodisulfide reductase subunit C
LAQLGIEEVLDAETIWVCASCLTCVARCPKGIDLPRIMEALRLIKMERSGDRLDARELPSDMVAEVPQLALIGGFRKFTS